MRPRENHYHESGHLVAASVLNIPVTAAEARGDGGNVWLEVPEGMEDAAAVAAIAGTIAGKMVGGPRGPSASDVDLIRHSSCAFESIARRAALILSRQWPAVEALAEALMLHGTLSGEAVKRIFDVSRVPAIQVCLPPPHRCIRIALPRGTDVLEAT